MTQKVVDGTCVLLEDLTPESRYEIYVFAEIGDNRSTYTWNTFNTVAIKTPPAPTKQTITQKKDNTVVLTFNVPYEDGGAEITSYVYRISKTDGTLVKEGNANLVSVGRLLDTESKSFVFTKPEL